MPAEARNERLEAAIKYAKFGLEVFPANPRNKVPLVDNGMKDATTDLDQIRAWWEQWPNALVAARVPEDRIVLDVDPRHGGDATWSKLQETFGPIVSRRRHRSGRGDNGRHHWFQRPPGKLTSRKLDEWARENGVGQATGKRGWTAGVDILHHGHRYSILPPSPHPDTGNPYEWEAQERPDEMPAWLADLVTSDPTPTEPLDLPSPPKLRQVLDSDSIADWFTASHDWNDILKPAGWMIVSGNGDEDGSRWRHPNASAQWSATIKHACLFVYSTNTDFEDTQQDAPVGYTRFKAWAILEHGGDMKAAARAAREMRDGPPRSRSATPSPPANVDPETGEITYSSINLPDEFWQARESLQHIRQAAHASLVSADALLLATLARVVLLIPPRIVLPAIVGGEVSLNLFVAIVDPSGGGKSASVSVARKLVTHDRHDIVDPILPSSGEGMIEAFFENVEELDDKGRKTTVKRKTKTAGYVFVDEGQGLLAQADRSGSTIMETIRSAWMGGDLGQHNAAQERKRWLKPHDYRMCIVMGFQLAFAASLIADGEGGTPQRFTFALATDPSMTADVVWPGEFPFTPPPTVTFEGVTEFGFHADIVAGIRQRRLQRSQGVLRVDPLDTHADLRKMKLAAALAAMEGRLYVDLDDWELAEMIDANSCAVRSEAIEYNRAAEQIAHRAAIARAVERETAIETASTTRALERITRNVARRVWRDGPMTPAAAFRVVSSKHRGMVDIDDVVALAVERKWLSVDGLNVAPGEARP